MSGRRAGQPSQPRVAEERRPQPRAQESRRRPPRCAAARRARRETARQVATALGVLAILLELPATAPAAPPRAPSGRPPPFAVAAPSRGAGATVARVIAPSWARTSPSHRAGRHRLGVETAWSRQALVLLVLDGTRRRGRAWVKLLLAERPNGRTGWIRRDRVVLGHTRWWVHVRLASRRVTVYRDGARVRRLRAVVGAAGTPTPTGLAAIYERNRQPDPSGFLGPWALALTSHSEVLMEYDGGPGRVAIHGRTGASLRVPLGTAGSLGCLRVDNRAVSWMAAHLPPGTPVRIARR